jgi:hypothetical protein
LAYIPFTDIQEKLMDNPGEAAMNRGKFAVKLDRIEGGSAVLLVRGEEAVNITMPVRLLPKEATEGETLIVEVKREMGDAEEEAHRIIESLGRLKPRTDTSDRD